MIDYMLSNINEEVVSKLGLHNYFIRQDTELKETEEGKYPMSRGENGFERISLDDDFDYIMYHRVTEEASTEDEEKSFGTKIVYENVIAAKMIVATKIHIGKDFVRDVKIAFPHKIAPAQSPTLTDGIFVETANINFVTDDNVADEFGDTGDYGKIKDNWLVSVISYTITTFECR